MKKAFLVGINKYQTSSLRGCVNDVLLMYKILSEKFNFNTNNIDIITDYQATRENIIKGLKKLTFNLSYGDIIYFHYSGHGSQVVVKDWTNNSEPDGRDEILCPIDLDWNTPLRDNDLKDIFINIPNGVKSTVVLDSCHSGTGLRNSNEIIYVDPDTDPSKYAILNKYISPPISNMLENPLISLDDDLNYIFPVENSKNIQSIKNKFLISTTDQGNNILISGCKDNQTSADAYMGGRYHGALTYSLVQSLIKKQFNIKYLELVADINMILKNFGFQQEPQLEAKKEFFGNQFLN